MYIYIAKVKYIVPEKYGKTTQFRGNFEIALLFAFVYFLCATGSSPVIRTKKVPVLRYF